jgi:hypothetical protein
MRPRAGRMTQPWHLLCCLLACLLPHSTVSQATGQVAIDVQILPGPNEPAPIIDANAIAQQGVSGVSQVITGTVDTQLVAQQCGQGTYSSNQKCVPCPNGTASAALGASDPSTCVPCPTGSYALAGSSVCTDCTANTFSVTPLASNQGVCLQCPPYTTSAIRSDNVERCTCNSGYFLSNNIISATNQLLYDTIPAVVSDLLAFRGASPIDVPHITCV